jgi:hypothetical protein
MFILQNTYIVDLDDDAVHDAVQLFVALGLSAAIHHEPLIVYPSA